MRVKAPEQPSHLLRVLLHRPLPHLLPSASNFPPCPPPNAVPVDKSGDHYNDKSGDHCLSHFERENYSASLTHWSAESPRNVYSRYMEEKKE